MTIPTGSKNLWCGENGFDVLGVDCWNRKRRQDKTRETIGIPAAFTGSTAGIGFGLILAGTARHAGAIGCAPSLAHAETRQGNE